MRSEPGELWQGSAVSIARTPVVSHFEQKTLVLGLNQQLSNTCNQMALDKSERL